jgi:succinate dehydrogenase / fumarate reductase cytochrome b subunit
MCARLEQEESHLMPKTRPKHLNLMEIRLPLPAFVSIAHRVSGAVLFFVIPLILCFLSSSLESAQSFAAFKAVVGHPAMKIILLGILWAYMHHLCAGVRHLAMDLHMGLELPSARAASIAVLVVSIAITLLVGALLW